MHTVKIRVVEAGNRIMGALLAAGQQQPARISSKDVVPEYLRHQAVSLHSRENRRQEQTEKHGPRQRCRNPPIHGTEKGVPWSA
jgi:hypothetical protein